MRAYLLTTGSLFVLIVIVHLARALSEGGRMLGDPMVLGSTVLSAAMAVWAVRLLQAGRTPQ